MDAASPTHMRLCVKMLACTALVCGYTMAYAEPLFFDCHGTYEVIGPRENLDYQPKDVTRQIMIDPDKEVVDAPGGGSNEYCVRESEWVPCGTRGGVQKAVKQCTTLQISETAYTYYTTLEGRNNCQYGAEQPPTTFQNWTMGSLNRITGEFFALVRTKTKDSDKVGLLTWKMTCTPVQRKF
jgi:hypothetical protein